MSGALHEKRHLLSGNFFSTLQDETKVRALSLGLPFVITCPTACWTANKLADTNAAAFVIVMFEVMLEVMFEVSLQQTQRNEPLFTLHEEAANFRVSTAYETIASAATNLQIFKQNQFSRQQKERGWA